jgi:hypothetical protein
MRQILKRIASFIRIDDRKKGVKRQGGYVVIMLAAIGLFGSIAAAAPILNRAVGSLSASDASAAGQSGASSAAEHALWRLRNDPSLWSSMTGSPPSTNYTYDVLDSSTDANVSVTALTPPPDEELRVAMTVSPDVLPPSVTGQFTYNLTVTNDDIVPQQIDRVRVTTILWDPDAVSGTTSGMTTDDPSTSCTYFFILLYCRWTWYPGASVDGFGGESTLTWTAEDSKSGGSFFATAEVLFSNGDTITAPNSARVRYQTLNSLDVMESVTPDTSAAGSATTYDYTLTIENNGADPLTIEWIRHWSHPDLSMVSGSSRLDGVLISDPAATQSSWLYSLFTLDSRDRYQWNVLPTEINPGESKVLTFQMQGSLEPGTYYSRASVLVEEALGGIFAALDLSTSTSGESAPITTLQGFTVTAEHDGGTVEVTGHVTADGIEILSWKEY